MNRVRVIVLVACLMGAVLVPSVSASTDPSVNPCSGGGSVVVTPFSGQLSSEVLATGRIALPAGEPRGLIAMFHGYGHNSDSWVGHVTRAAEAGYVAFATDYQGTDPITKRGWRVKEGATEGVLLAQGLLSVCPNLSNLPVAAFGVSMGGNASGLAVAKGELRPDTDKPLFDYWFDIEGATNVTETYTEASAVALSGNVGAGEARDDIEEEFGGSPLQAPAKYRNATVVANASKVADGLGTGVVIIHAVDDGLVPYNQSVEMYAAISALKPTEMYTILTSAPGEDGATLSGYALQSVYDNQFGGNGPFAGHATESSTTHRVMVKALERLYEVMGGEELVPGSVLLP